VNVNSMRTRGRALAAAPVAELCPQIASFSIHLSDPDCMRNQVKASPRLDLCSEFNVTFSNENSEEGNPHKLTLSGKLRLE
jgi:hypothetical protein